MKTQLRFDGRAALVTGAGGVLGQAYAGLLAARGAKVVVNDAGTDVAGRGASAQPAEAVAREINEWGGQRERLCRTAKRDRGARLPLGRSLRWLFVLGSAGFVFD